MELLEEQLVNMSVRAYRVNSKDIKEESSFNTWNDEKLMDFFDRHNDSSNRVSEDGGSYTVSVAGLKEAVAKAGELELDEELVKALWRILTGRRVRMRSL